MRNSRSSPHSANAATPRVTPSSERRLLVTADELMARACSGPGGSSASASRNSASARPACPACS